MNWQCVTAMMKIMWNQNPYFTLMPCPEWSQSYHSLTSATKDILFSTTNTQEKGWCLHHSARLLLIHVESMGKTLEELEIITEDTDILSCPSCLRLWLLSPFPNCRRHRERGAYNKRVGHAPIYIQGCWNFKSSLSWREESELRIISLYWEHDFAFIPIIEVALLILIKLEKQVREIGDGEGTWMSWWTGR